MSDRNSVIQLFHDYGIYYPSKTIEIEGEITQELASQVLKNLHTLDRTESQVTIFLTSPGGDVDAGFKIYDAIRAMKANVRIIGYAGIESMASVIFQAADDDNRFLMPNSFLMLHEGESEMKGSKKDREQYKRLNEWQENRCLDIYLQKIKEKKPRYTKDKLIQALDKDWIVLPEEAVKIGLADRILETY